eukprot:m.1078164 g.1078164  ORF g.1078164 m.1078164 type:complete len:346 (-) comp24252_c0_seq20:3744-4781(-)
MSASQNLSNDSTVASPVGDGTTLTDMDDLDTISRPSSLTCFIHGLRDSVNITSPIKFIYGSAKVGEVSAVCFFLNGIIFLGGMKFLGFVNILLVRVQFCIANTEQHGTLQCVYDRELSDEEMLAATSGAHVWIQTIFFTVPILILSKILSNFFFQEIADAGYAYMSRGRKKIVRANSKNKLKSGVLGSLMSGIADIIYDSLLLLALVLQISVLSCIDLFIPPVGSCVALVYTAWLHSLYCFEYTWIHKGMGFNERISFFETNWEYFLGFGLPVASLQFFLETFTYIALNQVLFPISLLIAMGAKPVQSCPSLVLPERMPICKDALNVSDLLMGSLRLKDRRGRQS